MFIKVLRNLDLASIERIAYLTKLVTSALAFLKNDHIHTSHFLVEYSCIVLLAFRVQIVEIG